MLQPLVIVLLGSTVLGSPPPDDATPAIKATKVEPDDDRRHESIRRLRAWKAVIEEQPKPARADERADDIPSELVSAVLIPPDWTGGDEGLLEVETFPECRRLYLIGKPMVSERGLAAFAKRNPKTTILRRPRVWLGVGAPNVANEGGIPVGAVRDGSPAKKAGVKPGDRIVKLDGTKVGKLDDIYDALTNKEPGDMVILEIARRGKVLQLEVELDDLIK